MVIYKFWIEPRADEEYDHPVLLTLHGNALDGSHFDNWRYQFHDFIPGAPSEYVFALPQLCANVAAQPLSRRTPHALRMLSLLPPTIRSFGALQTVSACLSLCLPSIIRKSSYSSAMSHPGITSCHQHISPVPGPEGLYPVSLCPASHLDPLHLCGCRR